MAGRHGKRGPARVALAAVAVSLFVAYCAWNLVWMLRGRIPPSLLTGVIGVPAPTTGMTRAWRALLQGDWTAAFLWNPFALPVSILYALSLWTAWRRFVLRRNVLLPRFVAVGWLVVLPAAWVVKIAMGSRWW